MSPVAEQAQTRPRATFSRVLFLEGRRNALAMAENLTGLPPAAIIKNLERSLAGRPAGYAAGITDVINLIRSQEERPCA